MEVSDFPRGAHAQIIGLASKPELNDEYCSSLGPSPGNADRVTVTTRSGAQLSLKPLNLRTAELLPGSRVVVQGLTNAAKYNGAFGEVLSWQGDRWIVDLDGEKKERKSFRSDNLVIIPALVGAKKRSAPEAEEPEAKKLKTTDLRALDSTDERVVGQALQRILPEFPILAMKCVCVLATKQTVTVMHELAQHMTDKQNDGLLRRPLKPGEKVKGIEELDALEQCQYLASKRLRALSAHVRINYCDLYGFIKAGMKEPKFNRKPQQP
mmetsp:Transcript_57648/g.166946  ORF Transcript_57648/g.166946 Transcript_57648/m.166946 type:complete len:267 (+) Transcript_57648:207-1007(+)